MVVLLSSFWFHFFNSFDFVFDCRKHSNVLLRASPGYLTCEMRRCVWIMKSSARYARAHFDSFGKIASNGNFSFDRTSKHLTASANTHLKYCKLFKAMIIDAKSDFGFGLCLCRPGDDDANVCSPFSHPCHAYNFDGCCFWPSFLTFSLWLHIFDEIDSHFRAKFNPITLQQSCHHLIESLWLLTARHQRLGHRHRNLQLKCWQIDVWKLWYRFDL